MKYAFQFLIIIIFSFIGEVLNAVIPLPVPACIYGIVLLYLTLQTGVIHLEHVREAAHFLIKIIPILLLPPAVGLIATWESIKASSFYYVLISVVSTVVVMAVAGLVTQAIIRRSKKRNEKINGMS